MNLAIQNALRPLRELPNRIQQMNELDQVSKIIQEKISKVIGPGTQANDLLSGQAIGHPLHPMLTDVAIGAWSSAVVLDLIGGKRSRNAADRLVALGTLSAVPTAASGWSDWSTLYGPDQRVGLAHAAANVSSTALFAMSWLSRKRGKRLQGKVLALVATGTVSVGGYLGAHLAYKRGVGVDHTAFSDPGTDWVNVGPQSAVEDGTPMVAEVNGAQVMIVKHEGSLYAMLDSCSHQGGPLHEGKISDGCVTCPWHASVFKLQDGSVQGGPTAFPQPVLQARIHEGNIEVRKG